MKNRRKIIFITLVLLIVVIFLTLSSKKQEKAPISGPTGTPKESVSPTSVPNIVSERVSSIAFPSQVNSTELYGINKKNGNLIKYTGSSEVIIYKGSVKSYDIQGNTAVVIDTNSLDQITIIDLKTNTQKKITVPNPPAVSVALSDDESTIYFLGEFSITNKRPSINSISVNGTGHKKIGETTAQSLKFLKDDTLLLFTENHAEDKGVLHFYDINQAKISLSVEGNSFIASPDKNNVAVKSTRKINIVNTETLTSRSQQTPQSNRYVWADNNHIIIVQNTESGIDYGILTLSPFKLTPFNLLAPNSSVLTAIGLIRGRFIWLDYEENTQSIPLTIE